MILFINGLYAPWVVCYKKKQATLESKLHRSSTLASLYAEWIIVGYLLALSFGITVKLRAKKAISKPEAQKCPTYDK